MSSIKLNKKNFTKKKDPRSRLVWGNVLARTSGVMSAHMDRLGDTAAMLIGDVCLNQFYTLQVQYFFT